MWDDERALLSHDVFREEDMIEFLWFFVGVGVGYFLFRKQMVWEFHMAAREDSEEPWDEG